MPSTTIERFNRISSWFNGDIDCAMPENVLKAQGFTVSRDWVIRKPTPSHTMTFEQFELVAFLVQEWDYGFEGEPVMIQLKWTDEKVWRDYREVPRNQVDSALRAFAVMDDETLKRYPHHRFRAEFRVKP